MTEVVQDLSQSIVKLYWNGNFQYQGNSYSNDDLQGAETLNSEFQYLVPIIILMLYFMSTF